MNDKFEQFLYKANTSGYGSADVDGEKLSNGEHIMRFNDGNYEFKDVYYGGEPYAGQEVIFKNGRAIWAMQYRGSVAEDEDLKSVYAFLGEVLMNTEIGLPRGKDGFCKDGFLYSFKMSGGLEDFVAQESISKDKDIIYSASFCGGLVDVRKEA